MPTDKQTPSSSAVLSLWGNWWDGFLLFFWFAFASAVASFPIVILARLARAVGGTPLERFVGSAALIIAGPVVLSRAFRALDCRRPIQDQGGRDDRPAG